MLIHILGVTPWCIRLDSSSKIGMLLHVMFVCSRQMSMKNVAEKNSTHKVGE